MSVPMQPNEPVSGDNESTAELPVLDVEAYEASLEEDHIAHTDTWVAPQSSLGFQPVDDQPVDDTAATARRGALDPAARTPAAVDLTGLSATLRAVEDRLRQKGERLVALERELAAVRADHIAAIAQSEGSAEQQASLRASLETADQDRSRLERVLAERDARVTELEATLVQVEAEREAALIRVNCDLVLQREQSDARIQVLVTRSTELESELEQLASDHEAAGRRIRELEAEMSTRYDELELQATARENEYNARLAERDHDLSAAEEALQRLEQELSNKNVKLEELASSNDDWRSTIVEAQQALSERDQRIRQLESEIASTATAFGKIQRSIERLDPVAEDHVDAAVEGPQRMLIRTDGNTEFVHQLARRTRIGRGPESELQIDAQYISRTHAVIMAGPVHTTLEDLDSTNGVFVNGKRIARQTLKDGDRVTIGRMHFRYAVRSSVSR